MAITTESLEGDAVAASSGDIPTSGDVTVVMLAGIAGTRNGEDWPPRGGEVTLPAGEASDLIAGGLAALAENQPAKAPAKKAPAKKAPASSKGV